MKALPLLLLLAVMGLCSCSNFYSYDGGGYYSGSNLQYRKAVNRANDPKANTNLDVRLKNLEELRRRGVITDEEYAAKRIDMAPQ